MPLVSFLLSMSELVLLLMELYGMLTDVECGVHGGDCAHELVVDGVFPVVGSRDGCCKECGAGM